MPSPETVRDRQDKMLSALAGMFASWPMRPDSPYLPRFVDTFLRLYPAEAREVVDVLMELSHGVFVDAEAGAPWRDCYLAALRLDTGRLEKGRVKESRKRWRQAVLKDPQVFCARLGPQIRCRVPGREVRPAALGEAVHLSFDINTVEEGILRLIPHVTETDIARWQEERTRKPFADPEDFKQRCRLGEAALAELRF